MSNTFDRNNNDDYDDNDYEVDYDPFDDDDYHDITSEWHQDVEIDPSGVLATVTSDINKNNPEQQDCRHLLGEIEVLNEIKDSIYILCVTHFKKRVFVFFLLFP